MFASIEPRSVTHQHLLAAVAAELDTTKGRARILDVGCGEGRLIQYLHNRLPRLHPSIDIELHGFDVDGTESSNRPDFPRRTIARLTEADPTVDWRARIRRVRVSDTWPHPDESHDIVLTNQVIEHVADLDAFLAETRRVLTPTGKAINLFPLRAVIPEGHVNVPLAHRIRGYEQRAAWIEVASRVGLGTAHSRRLGQSEANAQYISVATYYRSLSQVIAMASLHDLTVSYRHTSQFIRQKLRQMTGRPLVDQYITTSPIAGWLGFCTTRFLTSVTLTFERAPRPPWG